MNIFDGYTASDPVPSFWNGTPCELQWDDDWGLSCIAHGNLCLEEDGTGYENPAKDQWAPEEKGEYGNMYT